jgi:lipopolysaccharide/colanic/teichoic acid biosynthesis glycosyltransferase
MGDTTDFRESHPRNISVNEQFPWLERIKPGHQLIKGISYRVIKRIIDLLLIILGLPVVLFIGAICVITIKIESPGAPAIYAQERTGKGGKRFKMYKFRSMVANADQLKQDLMHLNELQWPDFKIKNDPRITKIGNFLRKTSLDELPQLFNVFLGDMSLVGPRPTSFSATTYKLWQTERLDVVPGITGLWQLAGRGETEFDERLRLDIAYIERQCLWLDIQILFRTIAAVVQQRGTH